MVDRQEILEYMQHDAYRPLTVHELLEVFHLTSADDFRAFLKLLNDMEEKGEIVRTRTDRYGVPERMNLVVGRLQMKARGYGFVIPDVPGMPDLYVPAGDLNGAMSGDKVLARAEKSTSGPRREGKIVRILERGAQRIVGKLSNYRDHAFVTPLDKRFTQDVFVPKDDTMNAHDGYVVVVEITSFPTATRGPEGKVVEVLGHPDTPGIDILAVVRKYGLPEAFPEQVFAEAEAISAELTSEDLRGRRDLRAEVIVTIDGEDAKDLDDAVHVKRLDNGNYLLGVHIADVGYYVREGSALDKEAYKRGTSVYLVDRVIPMLPQRLSNNICSLNPKVDRLTMSCEMEFTPDGELLRHDIYPSVIRTTERMTYNNVKRILVDHDPDVIARYQSLVPMFRLMEELALILRRKRMDRGAVDFDFDEVKVVVDEVGHPVDIVQRQRTIAERIIEEFMLAANETVAEHFFWLEVPFVYRIHEEPDITRMMEFNAFIHNFGYHVKGANNKVHPRSLQQILEEVKGKREERVISTLMLRSMRQARYSPECVGHFGLAAKYYTHFTSPIRRYPDLMIHRIIREVLQGSITEDRLSQLREFVAEGAAHASERERIAQDAERECDQLKMVEYMLEHLGEEFDGIISGVTQFGLFVQLTNGVEGLIHISYLTDDYYVLNEKQMALVGERTRRVFRLGDPVRIAVSGANKEDLTIDFELIAHQREGTMVSESGVDTVIYDEDLSPADRRRQIAQRQALARERKTKGTRYRGDLGDGTRSSFGSAGSAPSGRKGGRSRRKMGTRGDAVAVPARDGYSGDSRSGKRRRGKFAKGGVQAAKKAKSKGRRGAEKSW